ncbi:MAG: hypothetical protein ACRYGM_02925 [Janthinobacterium lividum]
MGRLGGLGGCRRRDVPGQGDGAADGAGDAVEGDGGVGQGVAVRACGLLVQGVLVQRVFVQGAGQAGAAVHEVEQDGAEVGVVLVGCGGERDGHSA